MQSRYNHERRILNKVNSPIRAIDPGMFIEFQYDIKNTSDPKHLVFVLWNDTLYQSKGKSDLIHGININYLTDDLFKKVFRQIIKNYDNRELNVPYTRNPSESKYDDDKSNRNLIKGEFTMIDLAYTGNVKDGRKLGMSETQRQLDLLYEKQIKPFVKNMSIYRTYRIDKMKTIRAIKYNLEF